jgi:alkylhydroperoxidase family enzyme
MLGFLEVMTLEPSALDASHAETLAAAGVSREAADDAVMVAVLFNMIDRVADSLGFEIPSPEAFKASTKMLLSRGYA